MARAFNQQKLPISWRDVTVMIHARTTRADSMINIYSRAFELGYEYDPEFMTFDTSQPTDSGFKEAMLPPDSRFKPTTSQRPTTSTRPTPNQSSLPSSTCWSSVTSLVGDPLATSVITSPIDILLATGVIEPPSGVVMNSKLFDSYATGDAALMTGHLTSKICSVDGKNWSNFLGPISYIIINISILRLGVVTTFSKMGTVSARVLFRPPRNGQVYIDQATTALVSPTKGSSQGYRSCR